MKSQLQTETCASAQENKQIASNIATSMYCSRRHISSERYVALRQAFAKISGYPTAISGKRIVVHNRVWLLQEQESLTLTQSMAC